MAAIAASLFLLPILGSPWLVMSLVAFDAPARREFVDGFAKTPFSFVLFLVVVVYVLGGLILLTGLWVAMFLWSFFWRRELIVAPTSLTLGWRVGSISQARHFEASDIENLGLGELRGRRGRKYPAIRFEYAGRTVWVAPEISEEEATALLSGPLLGLVLRSRRPVLHAS